MAAIDLIVLGILKQEPRSAYDIQKLVEYRNLSRWVKISTPSIYKKVLQLEEKGYIAGTPVRAGKMPEKSVYSLTAAGEAAFERLMLELSEAPIRMFLDFNAVIVNLDSLPPERRQACLAGIGRNMRELTAYLEENVREKEGRPGIPETGMAVLQQQLQLAGVLETWLASVQERFASGTQRPGP